MEAAADRGRDPRRQHALPRRRRRELRLEVGHRLRRRSARRRCSASSASCSAPSSTAAIERSLEIGAGTGYFSLNLLQAGVVREATCTDISPGMVSTLARATRSGSGSRSETARADAESLPFADESFDLVLGHAVLHHLPDLRARVRASSIACCARAAGSRSPASRRAFGDRLAALPKRGANALAPLWRRADAGRPAPPPATSRRRPRAETTTSSGSSTSTRSRPTDLAVRARRPASPTSASAARNSWPTGSAGSTARSRRAPTRRRPDGCGASTPSTATSCSSGSTQPCSSRAPAGDLLQPASHRPQAPVAAAQRCDALPQPPPATGVDPGERLGVLRRLA